MLHEANREFAEVNVGMAKVQFRHSHKHGMTFKFRHLVPFYLPDEPVRLHDKRHRSVVQWPSVDIDADILAIKQLTDDGNHFLHQRFSLFPVVEIVFDVRPLIGCVHRGLVS